jgi:hypothetical protein
MTQEMIDAWNDYNDDRIKYAQEQDRLQDEAVTNALALLSPRRKVALPKLVEELCEDTEYHDFRLEEIQKEDLDIDDRQRDRGFVYYVDQHSVGMEGDQYVGTIYIKILKNKYLCFEYSIR